MAGPETPKPVNLVDHIEDTTARRVGIIYDEDEAFGKYAEQLASPLFSTLPRELRDLIWAYATAPYEDPDQKFEGNEYYCRPGHTARLKTDTNLLFTCRRIWLEANAMPMLQAEHSFYYHRAAPDARSPQWMSKLTSHNRQNFGHLHLFAQMYLIEPLNDRSGSLRNYFLQTPVVPGDFQPRVLHVTLRHTDWWHWENEAPLRLKDGWIRGLLDSPDLRSTETLLLELETLDYKVSQLEPILEQIKQIESREMETHLLDGQPLKTRFVLTEQQHKYNWEGPANINNQDFSPYAGKSSLKYHVVTLRWELKFPQRPGAFIPKLRRASRINHGRPLHRSISLMESLSMDIFNIPPPYGFANYRPQPLPRRGRRAMRVAHNHRIFFEDLLDKEYVMRRNSQSLAEHTETIKRKYFSKMLGAAKVTTWEEKWRADKALLKFLSTSE